MNVEFNEPPVVVSSRPARVSSLSQLVITWGIVKSEQGAQALFLIIAIICIAIAGYLFLGTATEPPQPTPAQVAL